MPPVSRDKPPRTERAVALKRVRNACKWQPSESWVRKVTGPTEQVQDSEIARRMTVSNPSAPSPP
jgi:hypothetical protein